VGRQQRRNTRRLPPTVLRSLEQVIKWYNQRGECSENRIKEPEDRLWHGADALRQFEANAVIFSYRVLAYNVGRLLRSRPWMRAGIGTSADAALEAL